MAAKPRAASMPFKPTLLIEAPLVCRLGLEVEVLVASVLSDCPPAGTIVMLVTVLTAPFAAVEV